MPAISIDKIDANSTDLDGAVGNDEQTVNSGDAATFKIKVTNTGGESLKDIKLTDPRALSCASDGVVNLSGKQFTNKAGGTVVISFSGNGNHNDNVLDIGESFTYICSEANTTVDYTNTASVIGT